MVQRGTFRPQPSRASGMQNFGLQISQIWPQEWCILSMQGEAGQGKTKKNKKKQGKTRQGKARGKNETKTPVVQRSKEKVKIMERFKTGSMVSALR